MGTIALLVLGLVAVIVGWAHRRQSPLLGWFVTVVGVAWIALVLLVN